MWKAPGSLGADSRCPVQPECERRATGAALGSLVLSSWVLVLSGWHDACLYTMTSCWVQSWHDFFQANFQVVPIFVWFGWGYVFTFDLFLGTYDNF